MWIKPSGTKDIQQKSRTFGRHALPCMPVGDRNGLFHHGKSGLDRLCAQKIIWRIKIVHCPGLFQPFDDKLVVISRLQAALRGQALICRKFAACGIRTHDDQLPIIFKQTARASQYGRNVCMAFRDGKTAQNHIHNDSILRPGGDAIKVRFHADQACAGNALLTAALTVARAAFSNAPVIVRRVTFSTCGMREAT